MAILYHARCFSLCNFLFTFDVGKENEALFKAILRVDIYRVIQKEV
jgi:hypothetical protein